MNTNDENILPGLGQIVKEEAHFAYGIQRVLLGVISVGLLIGSLYAFSLPDSGLNSTWIPGHIVAGLVCLFFSAAFAFGSWWANRIHKKLSKLQDAKTSSSE